ENGLLLSTVAVDLGRSKYRLTADLGTRVCEVDGISPVVLNVLYHRDGSIAEIQAVEPSSDADCDNGVLQFEFENRNLGVSELNLYTRKALSLTKPPSSHLEHIEVKEVPGVQIEGGDGRLPFSFPTRRSSDKENGLLLSTVAVDLGRSK